jgi:hypothetical protein
MSPRPAEPRTPNITAKEKPTVSSPRHRRIAHFLTPLVFALVAVLPASAQAAVSGPAWTITAAALPGHFTPGSAEIGSYSVAVTNTGAAPSDGSPVTITDTFGSPRLHVLPFGYTPTFEFGAYSLNNPTRAYESSNTSCGEGPPVSCTVSDTVVQPGESLSMFVPLAVDSGGEESFTSEIEVSGGGAPTTTTTLPATISAEPSPFEFMSTRARLGDAAGAAETRAGAHPYRMEIDFQLETNQEPTTFVNTPAQSIRDIRTALPRGVVVNPQAIPDRCSEAQLSFGECPSASIVGQVGATIGVFGFAACCGFTDLLYNMIAPPGHAANLGFNISGLGYSIHLLGGVDSAGEYALTADVENLLQYGYPSGAMVELWGDPSDPSHDFVRGECRHRFIPAGCPVEPSETPFLTMPSACSGALEAQLEIVPWQEVDPISAAIPTTDENDNPVGVSDCEALEFTPSLQARPTTNVADAPSGLEVDLHIPQEENINTRAQSTLRNTTVTLPEGLVVNPSSANGLGACSAAQFGLTSPVGSTPVRTDGEPANCPDASKLGTVQIDTPLLEDPVQGAVYLANPYENPFGSLLAIYIAVADPERGVTVKLAGEVKPDPQTGRLTTTVEESPELPFEDFKLSFFGGAAASLRTPAVCGQYSTTSSLTPWSAPQSGPPATPHDEWSIARAPGGGICPSQQGQRPNSPDVDTGTVSPIAASYSPFVFNLRREDGSQELSAVTIKTPPGLTGKLTGIPYCSEAALAAAASRSGREEEANPRCPSASQIGTAAAAAGAGPAPYWAKGTAYLAGPYKGGPVSLAIITPATAGPFDLGTIVVRSALRIDPETGQITAISDPIPSILRGIPLDVRQIQVTLDRSQFTRTGTSCDPFSVSGSALSTLGASAPFSERFQLAECSALGFKPKLSIRLTGPINRGGHPALRAVLGMPEGGANLASAAVTLPRSEFLDQSHIGTVCTRVQFAAGAGNGTECPPASIYGHAVAYSPLVDYAVEGPVILRSSSHELPDLVLALHGPPSQPVAFSAAARVDSVHGGIRSTFEATPDLPLSRVVLSMAGGRKGLLQNSTNICLGKHRASATLMGQNGKSAELKPALRNGKCAKQGNRKSRRGGAR